MSIHFRVGLCASLVAATASALGCGTDDEPSFDVSGAAGASGASAGAGGASAGAGGTSAGASGGPAGSAGKGGGSGAGSSGKGGASAGAGGASAGAAGASAGAAGASAGAAGASAGAAGAGGASAGAGGASAGAGGASAGAAGAAGKPFVPDPLPTLGDDPDAPCSAAMSGDHYQFLDDVCKAKKTPSVQDRDRACPIDDASPSITRKDGSVVTYAPEGAPITWDTTSLAGIVPAGMRITLILVRRVGGVPHYRYLSNGTHAEAFQPWSESKFMAVANAAGTLRQKSAYKVGLTAKVGSTPLGDLVTSIANYDDDPYSSNGLARWFHDIGGRAKANDLVHTWLGRPASETFGGNYGAAAPALGYTLVAPSGASITIDPDTTAGPANHFSTWTAAEFLKRLVHHRENAATRLPDIQWEDLRVLFFGAEGSAKYGPWGGLTADTTIYAQQYDMAYLEKRSHGQWLTLSKLGFGNSEFTTTSYACYPQLDDAGAPVAGWGRELVISTQMATGGTGSGLALERSRDRVIAKAYRAILIRVMDGTL